MLPCIISCAARVSSLWGRYNLRQQRERWRDGERWSEMGRWREGEGEGGMERDGVRQEGRERSTSWCGPSALSVCSPPLPAASPVTRIPELSTTHAIPTPSPGDRIPWQVQISRYTHPSSVPHTV
eukprot:3646534-Rhodomonas_salina.2